MSGLEKKSFDEPEDTKQVGRMKVDSITVGAKKCTLSTAAPGWKWSEDVKPTAHTDSCQINHFIYMISGRIHVRMNDGTEMDFKPGDIGEISSGHDGWTVGDDIAVWLDFPH